MNFPNIFLENQKIAQGFSYVIGCDEAGRGCLAGPVVAASVILDVVRANSGESLYAEINDSKKLSPGKRFILEEQIKENAIGFGIGLVDAIVVDEINIHNASLLAMKKSVEDLENKMQKKISHETVVAVDGKFIIAELNKSFVQEAVVGGDSKVLSIAAASILAKTHRDRFMKQLHEQFPKYGLDVHKGYATKMHREMIQKYGIVPGLHRKTFIHYNI